MPLSPGAKLGRYEILSPIGSGRMGEVYRAHDSRLKRDVAIKILPSAFAADAERFAHFDRVARAIASMNHPHICTLYEVGLDCLVMEYIEGTPLAGPLPVEVALRHAVQICDALSAVHRMGIPHGNLKPSNILVTASGIKLLDFGLALLSRDRQPALSALHSRGITHRNLKPPNILVMTASGMKLLAFGRALPNRDRQPPALETTATLGMTKAGTHPGTAAYMSPEQAETKRADALSDCFSFGLVLYEMLSGRRAFTGDYDLAVMAAIGPTPLQTTKPIESIVKQCLRKSPADRFHSMAQVKAALLAATSGVTLTGAHSESSPG